MIDLLLMLALATPSPEHDATAVPSAPIASADAEADADTNAAPQTPYAMATSGAPNDPNAPGYAGLSPLPCNGPCRTPADAIAESSRRHGVPGGVARYQFVVRNVGVAGSRIFINSEADYRNQRNISVAIPRDAAREIFRRTGRTDLRAALVGQTIVVSGRARRVRIGYFENGRPTGEYYYQTHIPIRFGNQIGRPAAG